MPAVSITDVRNAGPVTVLKRPIYEPLNAPIRLTDILQQQFGSNYNITYDSNLYKFVVGLMGDNGVAALTRAALTAKIQGHLEATYYDDLDRLFGNAIGLPRLPEESYTQDPFNDVLTQAEWDQINAADASYRHRCLTWMRAIMFGASPTGLSLAGEAATGYPCSIFENYKYLDDNSLTTLFYKDAVINANPSLYWRLGDLVGSATVADSSGNGHIGTNGTGVTLGEPGALSGDSTTSALFNNTSGSQITSSYSPFIVGSKLTFMGWAYRSTSTDYDFIISGSSNPWFLIDTTSETVDWRPDGSNAVTWSAAWPGTGQWVHWALTWNDATKIAELFINGASQGTRNPAAGFTGTGGTFQASNGGNPFNGYMQEVAVFETILPTPTIQAIYAARNPGSLGLTTSRQEFVIIPRAPSLTQAEERELVQRVDRLKPANTLGTIYRKSRVQVEVPASAVAASSEGFHVKHLVTGRSDINWPAIDPSKGYWITNSEQEAPTASHIAPQEDITYLDISSATASSSMIGVFNSIQQGLFPSLAINQDPLYIYSADNSIVTSATPLSITAPWFQR